MSFFNAVSAINKNYIHLCFLEWHLRDGYPQNPGRLNYLHGEVPLEVEVNENIFCKLGGYELFLFCSPFRVKPSGQLEAHDNSCKPCPVTASSPVCGSDGHNYASEVKEIILHQLLSLKALRRIIFLVRSIKTLREENGKCPCHRFK